MLPWLLRAIKQGEQTVRLNDGTLGVIPEQWLKKYGLLAGVGDAEERRLRFTRSQAGLHDALLAAEPQVAVCLAIAGYKWGARRIPAVNQEAAIQR